MMRSTCRELRAMREEQTVLPPIFTNDRGCDLCAPRGSAHDGTSLFVVKHQKAFYRDRAAYVALIALIRGYS